MEKFEKPLARQAGLVVQDMHDEVLVYDLVTNKAHCLNESAATVWRSCNGSRGIKEIIESFEKVTGTRVAEDFVWLAIHQLHENGLMEGAIETPFAGQSRRQALKKIGVASLVALPIIASLVAPQNTLAQTSSCRCTSPGNCLVQTVCPSTVNCNLSGICAP
jgi:hypothetical protein